MAEHYEQCVTCGGIDLAAEMVTVPPRLMWLAEDAPRLLSTNETRRFIYHRIGKVDYPQLISWAHSECVTDDDTKAQAAYLCQLHEAIERRASEVIA